MQPPKDFDITVPVVTTHTFSKVDARQLKDELGFTFLVTYHLQLVSFLSSFSSLTLQYLNTPSTTLLGIKKMLEIKCWSEVVEPVVLIRLVSVRIVWSTYNLMDKNFTHALKSKINKSAVVIIALVRFKHLIRLNRHKLSQRLSVTSQQRYQIQANRSAVDCHRWQ